MKTIQQNIVALVAIVIAIMAVVLVMTSHQAAQAPKGVTQDTTFLPSLGIGQLSLGQNCTDQYKATGSGSNGCSDTIIQRMAIVSGTTTPCAFLSPAATSTLNQFSMSPTAG